MGRRARQSFGAKDHSRVGSFLGAGPETRQLNQQPDPPLPADEGTVMNNEQLQTMKTRSGFVAALDQSGGSTPKALAAYGIPQGSWSNDDEMFALVHEMRARVITSAAFTSDRIVGAILFEGTMDRNVNGKPSADYLWEVKRVVPFLKVDKGLAPEKDGVQLMKPMPDLAALLDKANTKGIFGTKMRSVIKEANAAGIKDVVSQQFDVAGQIISAGLLPINEPEVDIHCREKAKAELMLKEGILKKLSELPANQLVMLKLTIPDHDDFYLDCIRHPKVLRVVALSGGYTRDQAHDRLRTNYRLIA